VRRGACLTMHPRTLASFDPIQRPVLDPSECNQCHLINQMANINSCSLMRPWASQWARSPLLPLSAPPTLMIEPPAFYFFSSFMHFIFFSILFILSCTFISLDLLLHFIIYICIFIFRNSFYCIEIECN
jgi:hypothetical protein